MNVSRRRDAISQLTRLRVAEPRLVYERNETNEIIIYKELFEKIKQEVNNCEK